jgi:hypothetical protein
VNGMGEIIQAIPEFQKRFHALHDEAIRLSDKSSMGV